MPKSPRSTTRRTSQAAREWVGGFAELPFAIAQAGDTRPTIALWLELPSGVILASHIGDGESVLEDLEATLRQALTQPLVGRPRTPTRVRVDRELIAQRLRGVLGAGVSVRVGGIPEVVSAAEDLTAHLARSGRTRYLLDDVVEVSTLAALFQQAALFAAGQPWRSIDPSQVFQVDIPALGVEAAAAMLVGHAGLSRALLLFPSAKGLMMYEALAATMHTKQGEMPDDMGSSVLAVSFDPAAELDPAALAQIRKRGYVLASDALIPVVEPRDSTGAPEPTTALHARTAVSVLAGLVKLLDARPARLSSSATESVATTLELAEGVVEVTVRARHQEYERMREGLAGLAERARDNAVPLTRAQAGQVKVGRNDACPCGSGKKYKKCCSSLQVVPSRAEPLKRGHELDQVLAMELETFAERELQGRHRASDQAFADARASLQLALPLRVFRTWVDGRSVAAHYLERHGARLSAGDRDWLQRQMGTHLSAWEVLDVVVGERMTLRDLVGGEERTVMERGATRALARRDVLLCRIVDDASASWMCGCYPRVLGPSEAAHVMHEVRRVLGLKKRDASAPMLTVEAETLWVRSWEAAVDAIDRAQNNRQLANTDGERLLLTTDHFVFAPGARHDVEQRIAKLPWASEPEEVAGERVFPFLRPGNAMHKGWDNTLYGRMCVSENGVRIETNSLGRADILRSRLEGICGELVRHRLREHQDPTSQAVPPPAAPVAPPPEVAALMQQEMERMMRSWLDQSVPALQGKTPRQAARTKRGREQVDLLLRDFERMQSRAPEGMRTDVRLVRAELGLGD
jgi:hypothetical protein